LSQKLYTIADLARLLAKGYHNIWYRIYVQQTLPPPTTQRGRGRRVYWTGTEIAKILEQESAEVEECLTTGRVSRNPMLTRNLI